MVLLWLDDIRQPQHYRAFHCINTTSIVWVKNYNEFVSWIEENGLPDGINFDHDLADEHYVPQWEEFTEEQLIARFGSIEKTGMDCAKWLVEYCLDNTLKLPEFASHSANPDGRKNILSLLNNFKKETEK